MRCKRAGTILPIDRDFRQYLKWCFPGRGHLYPIHRKGRGNSDYHPAVTDGKVLRNIVSNLDGLVLIGGADVNPLWYEEEPREKLEEVDPVRDLYELKLIKMATDQNIPVLGICRGLQLLNVAFGGTLYQDIPSQRGDHSVKHRQDLPSSYGSHPCLC